MTQRQLQEIIDFCQPCYRKTGRWHGWDHISAVYKLATDIAKKEFPQANLKCLQAAVFIHDIGRTVQDEGHPKTSVMIIEPFLKKIKVPSEDISIILEAVTNHDGKKINQAKSVEARILFDADKIEILTIYGFTRTWFWLVEERQMELDEALHLLWDYYADFRARLYSKFAKTMIERDYKLLTELVQQFDEYQTTRRQ